MPIKVLFVCGRNKRRSPTAEKIFRNDPRLSVRSAGTSPSSRRKIREGDLLWADRVLVMERKYAARIHAVFRDLDRLPPMESLEIPDDYEFMDAALIELLHSSMEEILFSKAAP